MINFIKATINSFKAGPSFTLFGFTFTQDKRCEPKPQELYVEKNEVPNPDDILTFLDWRSRLTKFIGRKKELTDLRNWLKTKNKVHIRFIDGPGGLGKTRMAAHFAERIRSNKWSAGFIRLNPPNNHLIEKNIFDEYRQGRKGTLIIIDYPEAHFIEVDQFLNDIRYVNIDEIRTKIRVLFLIRPNPKLWETRFGIASVRGRADFSPFRYEPISPKDATRTINQAAKQTSKILKTKYKKFKLYDVERWIELNIDVQPLYLIAAGVHSVFYPKQNTLKLSAEKILSALAEREYIRLMKCSKAIGFSENALPFLLLFVSITGKISYKDIERDFGNIQSVTGIQVDSRLDSMLVEYGLSSDGYILPIVPDLIAAAFKMLMEKKYKQKYEEILSLATKLYPERSIQNIARINSDESKYRNIVYTTDNTFSILNKVSFVGRERELQQLQSWTQTEDRFSITFIIGPGGSGKTTIATLFAQRMMYEGWGVKFLSPLQHDSFLENCKWKNCLIIFDDVDCHLDTLVEMISNIYPLNNKRLRLLAISRGSRSYWEQQTIKINSIYLVTTFMETGILSTDEAYKIYNSAYRSTLHDKITETKHKMTSSELQRWISQNRIHNLPLFIAAAGIFSSLYPKENWISFSAPRIVNALVNREILKIRNLSIKTNGAEETISLLLSIATIAGGVTWDQIQNTWNDLYQKLCAPLDWNGKEMLRLGGWMNGDLIGALTPDIIAAGFVVTVLSKTEQSASELSWSGVTINPRQSLANIARMTHDSRYVLGLDDSLTDWVTEAVQDNPDRCRILEFILYEEQPYTLSKLAVAVGIGLENTAETKAQTAHRLINLSTHLSNAGDTRAALEASQRAVDILRELTGIDSSRGMDNF